MEPLAPEKFKTLVDLLETSCRTHALNRAFGTKTAAGWEWITFREFEQLVTEVRSGLKARAVEFGDRVAIIADNRVEWAAAAYATYSLGAVFVPMYQSQQAKDWQYILGDCSAKVCFCATSEIASQVREFQAALPGLSVVIDLELASNQPGSLIELRALGRENPTGSVHPKPEDIAGLIYTSGTTGEPKGVMLSHANFCSNVNALHVRFPLSGETSLAFLPWAHSLGQTGELHTLLSLGSAIGINDQIPNLVSNLPQVRPTVLVAVPRIFNRIYDGVHEQMRSKPGAIQTLFKRGLDLAQRKHAGDSLGLADRCTLGLADRLIFSKIRAKFGGRLKLVISGSAALSVEVAKFIDALGIKVYEGYGLTETSPVATVNYPGRRRVGSVGPALPGVQIEIDTSVSHTADEGEIIIRGPNVMQGYYGLAEETARVMLADGGFRSGDLGRLDDDGFLYITGRLKEQYKLENGKYVAPAPLEEQMKLSPYVVNVMLFGDNRPHNVALVVPDPERLERWAAERGETPEQAAASKEFSSLLIDELNSHCTGAKGYERPKRVAVLSEDFTIENGLLTPSLKLKRREAVARFAEQLDALYT